MIWSSPPAIIIPKPVTPFRFFVNDGKEHDCGACLPRDLASMPAILRATVSAREIRPYLPEPFRRLSDGMILSLLANVGGLPGVLMAGGIKTAWLYTASGVFSTPGYWNSDDNEIHAVGAGGTGRDPTESGLFPGEYYGGPGGGGTAWAALVNAVLTAFVSYTATVGTSAGDSSWFDSVATLLAVGGHDGGNIVSGSGSGGAGGDAASCIGNLKSSGGDGEGTSGFALVNDGGRGGGAGGPHGDGTAAGDAGFGGLSGDYSGFDQFDGGDGVDGSSGGWNSGSTPNAGSGGGGGKGTGTSGSGADPNGHNGGLYGAGSGGAGVTADPFQRVGVPGTPAPGCLLLINNASL